jgi:hypothetical protein
MRLEILGFDTLASPKIDPRHMYEEGQNLRWLIMCTKQDPGNPQHKSAKCQMSRETKLAPFDYNSYNNHSSVDHHEGNMYFTAFMTRLCRGTLLISKQCDNFRQFWV